MSLDCGKLARAWKRRDLDPRLSIVCRFPETVSTSRAEVDDVVAVWVHDETLTQVSDTTHVCSIGGV